MRKFLLAVWSACLIATGVPPSAHAVPAAVSASVTPTLQQAGVYNLSVANTHHLRIAVDNVQNGQAAPGPVLIISDSTARGGGATSILNTWPFRLAAQLTAKGIPASASGVFGAGNYASVAAYAAFDTQFSAGTGWTLGQNTAGGSYFKWPGSLADTAWSLTPKNPDGTSLAYNQCDLWYISNTTTQTVTLDRSGTAPTSGGTTLNTAAPLGFHKATFGWSTTATGTFNVTPNSSGSASLFIVGAYCRNTASPTLEIINMAWAGSNSTDWVNTAYSPNYDVQTIIKSLSPVVGIVAHSVNDWNPGTTAGGSTAPTALSAYSSNISTLVADVQLTGDAILGEGPQSNPANYASIASQQTYGATLRSLSSSLNIPYVDPQVTFGSFAQASADGLTADDRHENNAGASQFARAYALIFNTF
jgi:hypothetical protein